jgi:NAD(P)-dependent dehydrogenase (short-subunit alcohol dehydrogenase family)
MTPSDERFIGMSALVTGGGRGLGKAVALALAARGCAVTVFARTAAEVEGVGEELKATSGFGQAVVGDITRQGDVEEAVERAAAARDGRLDILINAAGGFVTSPSLQGDVTAMRDMLEKNLIGAYAACAAAGRRMKPFGEGRIVNFGSLLSFTAFPERAAYAASKAGLLQMTRVLGVEWAPFGIAVNCIVPGMIQIETPHPLMTNGSMREDQLLRRIPAGRRGRPQDIVGPVLFLASRDAAYMAGQSVVVDGGWLSYGYL